jgi:hypothetical protein
MSQGKLRPVHLQRKAYVYVRQSSTIQMIEHAESKKRQYEPAPVPWTPKMW